MADKPIVTNSGDLRSISPAEFFEKNRHLLGFDNPIKALLTSVKEAVDNSLTYDMPFVLRENGRTKIAKIGSFIDGVVKSNRGQVEILRNGELEKLKVEGVYAPAFDSNGKLDFRKVSAIFRHKVNSDIFRVRLESGRYVDLTAYHSVFTLKEGKVIAIPTNEVKEGTHLIVPRRSWGSGALREINLIEELLRLPAEETTRINLYGVSRIFSKYIINELKKLLPKEKYYRIQDFKRLSYLPINMLRLLPLDIDLLSDSKIGTSLCRYKIPAIITVNHELAELFGLYVSEGSTLKSLSRVCFSFGSHERDLIAYSADLFEKVFSFKPKIIKAHATAVNVKANCSILGFVLKKIFKVGDNARTKRIPEFVFDFPVALQQSFLMGYLAGDGYPSKELFELLRDGLYLDQLEKEKITLATASPALFVDLQYLLSLLGLAYSCGSSEQESREINNVKTIFSKSYQIYIYSKRDKSQINKLPIKDVLSGIYEPKLKYAMRENNQTAIYAETLNGLSSKQAMLYKGVTEFLESDLGLLKVTSVEKINYDKEWVYDISVPDCENFVAGVGAILCHNSLDACEGKKILPDIFIQIQKLGETRYKMIVEDNGPGIPKEHVAKAFGKLLYGSKFQTFGGKQGRGQQGIGISASVMYGQLTTGKPARIITKTKDMKQALVQELKIDVKTNEPQIITETMIDWKNEHGTRVEIELEAKYMEKKASVVEYVTQTAVVNPHAKIIFIDPEGQKTVFDRVVDKLPKEPEFIKPHPYGVELGVLLRMLKETSSRALKSFLTTEFDKVGATTADEILKVTGIDPKFMPKLLSVEQADKLIKAMHGAKIMSPTTTCLSPIEDVNLKKALEAEYDLEFAFAVTRPPSVYRGNPFLIEVAIGYGGELTADQPVKLIRFANRVPLLYQQGACALTKAITSVDWKNYGLQQSGQNMPNGPAIILVHMASVWAPFTSESKEAVAHYPEIIKEAKLALQEAGRQLQLYVGKKQKKQLAVRKADMFKLYAIELSEALSALTEKPKEPIHKQLNKLTEEMLKLGAIEEEEAKAAEEKTKPKRKLGAFKGVEEE